MEENKKSLFWTSGQLKVVFIHIPKTAGTSIKRALKPYLDKDCLNERELPKTTIECHNSLLDCDKIEGYFHFTCVRNTYQRIISYYYHSRRNNNNLTHINSFYDYLCYVRETGTQPNQINYISKNGVLSIDKILRYESLQADFDELSDALNIPRKTLPETNSQKYLWEVYPKLYGDKERKIVEEYFSKDIEFFGHKFPY